MTLLLGPIRPAAASIAYGSINNFDCVNDTGVEAHGFDIEIDDVHSTDITYTYDYNHYGVPQITQDNTDPAHPKVLVRYVSAKNPDGTWTAYTAVPSAPIAPTMGHEFTNPSINFGGEHFGVGYYGTPSAVKYNWLIDDGTGTLVHGAPVTIATPTFTYNPPVAAAPPAVEAVVIPPPPPAPPVLEFGAASWVKEIKTSAVNPNKVQLGDLVGADPGQPQPWANGEPAEVEVEWQMMQTDFASANGGKNGELQGAPEDLANGDEVVTRRYEFYKYTGPIDAETGEAVADTVGADGIHGVGSVTFSDHIDPSTGEWVTITTDLTKVAIVGDYIGAQMSGFDANPALGLIDHIQDGQLNTPFPDRTVVVAGISPFLADIKSGKLPDGLTLNALTGVVSGTPTSAGVFTFVVEASDLGGAYVSKSYTVTIAGGNAPASYVIGASSSPAAGGTTSGGGGYNSGDIVTLLASTNPGYNFVNWTEGGLVVSQSASYSFTATANRDLVANFLATYSVSTSASPAAGGSTSGGGVYNSGDSITVLATATPGYNFVNWTESGIAVSPTASYSFTASANRALVANFVSTAKDVTPPVTTATLSGSPRGHGWYPGPVQVTLSATDDLSGVQGSVYQLDGGVSQAYAGPFTVSSSGRHKVTFWSLDNTGNIEKFHVEAVYIDLAPPSLSATANPATLTPPNSQKVSVTIAGKVTDGLSGVDVSSGRYSINNGVSATAGIFAIAAGGTYAFPIPLEAKPGRTYTVTLQAKDLAGNAGATSVVVTVPLH